MDFPLGDLLDPERGHDFLLSVLHPHGCDCPQGHALEEAFVHKRDRAPILDDRGRICGRCFNLLTGTVLRGTHDHAVQGVQRWHGIAEDQPTAPLVREMGVDRKGRLIRRHQRPALGSQARSPEPLPDPVIEVDERDQKAGEKRRTASPCGGSPSSARPPSAGAWDVGAGAAPGLRNRRPSDETSSWGRGSPQHRAGTGSSGIGGRRARRLREQ
jgi:hypothetical protein